MNAGLANQDSADAQAQTDLIARPVSRAGDGVLFFHALRVSRLLPEDEIRQLENDFEVNAQRTLSELFVRSGKLTRYQFERLRNGEPEGLVVGPYSVMEELGRGGGGSVYRARHTVMNRTVALKVIDPRYTQTQSARDVFQREVAAATRLEHPNIVQLYDANECDGLFYLAMELVEGLTLHRYVCEKAPVSPAEACTALLQVAKALKHSNEKGLVHRDIKPANIMVLGFVESTDVFPPRPAVKVLDFGLARLYPGGDRSVTTIHCPEGAALGTPAFMSPEQIRNFHAVDIRSDLYSLGCTFYFALSGRLPFEGPTTSVTLMMQMNREPAPLRTVCPAVPQGLAQIVHRLMAKNPADRYQMPEELIEALNEFILSGGLDTELNTDSDRASAPPAPLPAQAIAHDDATPPTRPATPQTAPPDSQAVAVFHQLWTKWAEVVEATLQGEWVSTSEVEYRQLYQRLLAALQAVRGHADAPSTPLLDWVQAHVEPWVTLQSIYRLDHRTRMGLYWTNRELDAKFRPPSAHAEGGSWVPLALAVILGVTVYLAIWNWPQWMEVFHRAGQTNGHTIVIAALLGPVLLLLGALVRRRRVRT